LSSRSRSGSTSGAVLVALLFLAGVALSLTLGRSSSDDDNTPQDDLGTVVPPSAGAALGTFAVKDLAGHSVPLVAPGEASVIMLSSNTCTWCRQTLADLHELARGRPLPHLRMITLEGASEGVPMLAREGLTGAQLFGPESGADQVFLMFRYPGTPTFLIVDTLGRVTSTIPGYPGKEQLKGLFAVMTGDRTTP
jgi:hypothetical protein